MVVEGECGRGNVRGGRRECMSARGSVGGMNRSVGRGGECRRGEEKCRRGMRSVGGGGWG